MTPVLADFSVGNDFVARDILLGLKDRPGEAYVSLILSDVHEPVEGTLKDVVGGTALLQSGKSLRFVDLDRVVIIRTVLKD